MMNLQTMPMGGNVPVECEKALLYSIYHHLFLSREALDEFFRKDLKGYNLVTSNLRKCQSALESAAEKLERLLNLPD